jgi:hypothetical protein
LKGGGIPFVKHIKHLDAIIDRKITWRLHIETITTEVFRALFVSKPFSKCEIKVKGKVIPGLFLTKHHAMKAYWGEDVQLHSFFDLGTRWR